MFTRIVKLSLKPESVKDFLDWFEMHKVAIRNQDGCLGLKLLQDKHEKNILFTYSKWRDERDLEAYRNSELFAKVWKRTKEFFQDKAEAWSVNEIEHLP